MTPELWQRLKPLYEAALDIPEGDRAKFIADACHNDDQMKAELEAFLSNSGQSSLLDIPFIQFKDLFGETDRVLAEGELIEGRFQIVRHLGRGGMGDVYEANDIQLGRIALKTIRSGLAAGIEPMARFRKEVQLARDVTSPHVCRIHELHLPPFAAGGPQTAFLTMEFLEGITLTDRISAQGPLPWREAQKAVLEICSGLQCMHEAHIIHRDIKGRNIMLANRNGHSCAVVMDFGIARHISPGTTTASTGLTRDGAIVGTPDYMAPEQSTGDEVSPATDIYALGIVFYEALTGKYPFPETDSDHKSTNRSQTPVRASAIRSGVPRRFDRVISKCLEYDPKRRYQSAEEAAQAVRGDFLPSLLRQRPLAVAAWVTSFVVILSSLLLIPAIGDRVRGVLFSSREKHIAVLPFDVIGGGQETQALGDGLMDSLSGRLSNLDTANKSLWVVASSEVRRSKVTDPVSAGRELGATIVIKGTFDRNDRVAHLKLTVIDPRSSRVIGYREVEDQSGDLASLEDNAVAFVARLLNVAPGRDAESENTREVPRAAYEDYLAALGYIQRFDQPGNVDRAVSALRNSIKTDPGFVLGFAALCRAYTLKYRLDSNPQWLDEAQISCKKAVELDDSNPSTYIGLADVHELTGQHDLAIQEFRRAIKLDPQAPEAFSGIAFAYQNAGRNSEAEDAYRRATLLRPDDWNGYNNLGNFYVSVGRPRDALPQFNRALQLSAENSVIYCDMGIAYLNAGDPTMLPKAEQALRRSISLSPTYQAYANLGNLYGIQRRYAESAEATRKALQIDGEDYAVWMNLAQAYDALGEEKLADGSRRQAITLARRAIKLNSKDADAYATLAALLAKSRLNAQALQLAHVALALAPTSESVLADVADTYEILGDRKHAIQYLKEALSRGLPIGQINGDTDLIRVSDDPGFIASLKVSNH